MDANKGILLIAIGNYEYLRMAENLAMSIKNVEPEMPITLAHNYPLIESKIFDNLVVVPKESYTTNGKLEYIKVKTWMYDFSPYDETIFLDVDMIWFYTKKPSELFEECAGTGWTMSNTGLSETSVWCDINDIRKLYPKAQMWNYHSECVYFDKSPKTKKYFDTVKEVYENPPIKGTNFGGARIADELAFQLASLKLNEFPHKENFTPIFWYARDRKTAHLQAYKLTKEYYAYSIGGNKLPIHVKNNYKGIAAFHARKAGIKRMNPIKDKRLFIPERMKI